MTIKAIYTNVEDIPENYRELFEERGGVHHLVKIEGLKTDADVARVQRSLESERQEKQKLKTSWDSFLGGRNLEEVQAMLDKYPELEALANGKVDEEKIGGLVEARLRTKVAPVERERDQYKAKLSETESLLAQYEQREKQRVVYDQVRSAAQKMKVLDTAQEDVLLLAERVFEVDEHGSVSVRDGVGVTPGVSPEVWLAEMQQKRPHWWPVSAGAGSRGSGGSGAFVSNPWSADNWNLTRQGEVLRTLGPEKAAAMAAAAGSSVGATRPAPKK